MKMKLECLALFAALCLPLCAQHVYDMSHFGIQPGKKSNMSARMEKVLAKIKKEVKEGEAVTLRFQNGTYHFYPEGAAERTYYISNHDQDNPKSRSGTGGYEIADNRRKRSRVYLPWTNDSDISA